MQNIKILSYLEILPVQTCICPRKFEKKETKKQSPIPGKEKKNLVFVNKKSNCLLENYPDQ